MLEGEVLLLGGSGTLGKAIIRLSVEEKWNCNITIFSGDVMKHHRIKQMYPMVNTIVGDVRDFTSLLNAMTGKTYVLHLAAKKHIPECEYNSIDTFEVNVSGSLNVCMAAMQLDTPHVLGISTDKAAHPVNCYGATKMLMEKIFQEYARLDLPTQFHLVRYGNVLESTGSVVEVWRKAVERGEHVKVTDPDMTRFWLSPTQAAKYAIKALDFPSGCIYIPKMPALSIGKLAFRTLAKDENDNVSSLIMERVPIRPGEKMHEELLTKEEGWYTLENEDFYLLAPTTAGRFETAVAPFSSDIARELTREELTQLLEEG